METPPILVCERVVDDVLVDDLRSKWTLLAEASIRLHVKITFERTSTVEGYRCICFLIRGETLEQTMQYVEAVRTLSGLETWEPFDPEIDILYTPDFKGWNSLPYGYNPFEELAYPFDGKFLEAWGEDAWVNSFLPKRLAEYPPIFLAHDWIVPPVVPDDWLELYFKAMNHAPDSPEALKRYLAIFKENTIKWSGPGPGYEHRYHPSLISVAGKAGVRLMWRWHSYYQELWEFFVANWRSFGIPMETWEQISVEAFRWGRVIWGNWSFLEHRRANMLQLVEKARRLNGGG